MKMQNLTVCEKTKYEDLYFSSKRNYLALTSSLHLEAHYTENNNLNFIPCLRINVTKTKSMFQSRL